MSEYRWWSSQKARKTFLRKKCTNICGYYLSVKELKILRKEMIKELNNSVYSSSLMPVSREIVSLTRRNRTKRSDKQ